MRACPYLTITSVCVFGIGLSCQKPAIQKGPTDTNSNEKPSIWKPDPDILGHLTQSVDADTYQLSVPTDFTFSGSKLLPSGGQQFAWGRKAVGGGSALVVSIFSEKTEAERTKDMANGLASFWHGMFETTKTIENAKRDEVETGSINGVRFCRFTWNGSMKPNLLPVRGLAYGTLDSDSFIAIIGFGIGEEAEKNRQLLDSVIATFKKK
jgi:hypothetical protein